MNNANTVVWAIHSATIEGIVQQVVDGKRTKESAIRELADGWPMVSPFVDEVGHRLYVEANTAIKRLLNWKRP